jgi:NAD(P)-dependent dehydrogenase (short-subunit alcohol dehydrogenase family)
LTLAAARRVLVTGGTSALGSAIVERLTEEGDRIVFTGRNKKIGAALADTTGSIFFPGNIRQSKEIDDIVLGAKETLGGLDSLVLNAAVLQNARVSETSDSEWDAVIETNLIAPFLFARACMPMLAVGGGSIVAIVSGTALWTEMELGAYSISKRALLWMTQMLAVEGATQGVTVNAICPGDTESGMTANVGESHQRDLGPPVLPPLGRYSAPEDIASAVSFFLSADSAFCTGTSLTVDGGMRAALRASKVHS